LSRPPPRMKPWRGPLPRRRITPAPVMGDFIELATSQQPMAAPAGEVVLSTPQDGDPRMRRSCSMEGSTALSLQLASSTADGGRGNHATRYSVVAGPGRPWAKLGQAIMAFQRCFNTSTSGSCSRSIDVTRASPPTATSTPFSHSTDIVAPPTSFPSTSVSFAAVVRGLSPPSPAPVAGVPPRPPPASAAPMGVEATASRPPLQQQFNGSPATAPHPPTAAARRERPSSVPGSAPVTPAVDPTWVQGGEAASSMTASSTAA
jgi:hypothetical protein